MESVQRKPDVYVAPLGTGMDAQAAHLASELRRKDLVVELGDETFRMKKSLEIASKIGARFALIVGENEITAGQYTLKDMASGEQVNLPLAAITERIQPAVPSN